MPGDQRRVTIRSKNDAESLHERIAESARHTAAFVRSNTGDPLELLFKLRFDKVGMCPIKSSPLNVVEQLNQTFTILATLRATEKLLDLHPDVGGFVLSLGTCPGYDIQSVLPNQVIAEVFAATHHRSNGKLTKEIKRLRDVAEVPHKYVFFASPCYAIGRRPDLETSSVQVYVTGL